MHPLISHGLALAFYGMSTVFVLLTLLVLAIFAMSKVLKKFERLDENMDDRQNSKNKLAAIVGAIVQHRRSKSIK